MKYILRYKGIWVNIIEEFSTLKDAEKWRNIYSRDDRKPIEEYEIITY